MAAENQRKPEKSTEDKPNGTIIKTNIGATESNHFVQFGSLGLNGNRKFAAELII